MKAIFLSIMFTVVFITSTEAQSKAPAAKGKYLFYFHGGIIEEQGANAVSEKFGPYEYRDILATFSKNGFKVISEVRPKDTDAEMYAKQVAAHIQRMLKDGVRPRDITVVGASKGAYIAFVLSTILTNQQINYAVMGMCGNDLKDRFDKSKLCGRFLSIYEQSDQYGSCNIVLKGGTCVSSYKEIRLNTGRSHGFLYKAYPEWIQPLCNWAKLSK